MNPRQALTAAINRAIASGAPRYTELTPARAFRRAALKSAVECGRCDGAWFWQRASRHRGPGFYPFERRRNGTGLSL